MNSDFDGGSMKFRAGSVGRARVPDSQRVVLNQEFLVGNSFEGRHLVQFSAAASRLERCSFEGARIESASLGAGRGVSEYIDCSFDRVRIHFGPGGYARFIRCSFRDVDLREWICFTVELVDCVFSGSLRTAIFNGRVPDSQQPTARRVHNEFTGNDFSSMDLIDVAFRTGIDLTKQRLPTGQDYLFLPDAVAALERVRIEVVSWTDLEQRRAALRLISSLDGEVEGGQQQLLIRQDTYRGIDKRAVESVFSLLGQSRDA